MALEATMRRAGRRLARAFRNYAATHGWGRDDYRALVEFNLDWGRIHVILLARDFPGQSKHDQWYNVFHFLDSELQDEPELAKAINLSLRTFDQVEEGGIYRLSPDYVDVEDLGAITSPEIGAPRQKLRGKSE